MSGAVSIDARAATPRSRLLERLIAVDHPDRSSSFPTRPIAPAFLRVDHAQDLPLIALDELGREVARFRHLADLAHFLNADSARAPTLPFTIVHEARKEDGHQLLLSLRHGGAL